MQCIFFNHLFASYTCTLIHEVCKMNLCLLFGCSLRVLFTILTKNISFKSSMENKQQTLRFLPHTKTKGIVDVMKRPESLEIEPMAPGFCNKCSAMQLGQLDNHHPSQYSICTAKVVQQRWS